MTGFSTESLRGVIAPILTPFNDDLSVAHDLFTAHAQTMLEAGCAGLTPFGTTGEAPSVSRAERTNALWHLTQAGIDPKQLIPGTGLTNFHATAALSRACMDMGVAAVMIVPPFYYKNVQEDGLYAYYARVIDMVGEDVRVILYHIPHVSGVGLPISLVQRLRKDFPEQIIGVKDSSGDMDNLKALMRIDGLAVYPGSEVALIEAAPLGALGTITATVNLNAKPVCEFVTAILEGDSMEVEYMRDEIGSARDVIAARDFIATPKRLLAIESGDARWANVRPPLVAAPDAAGTTLRDALTALR